MGRADGRVQPGQRLDTAFSARAWNRAQDAADIVLGDRGGVAAGSRTTAHLPHLSAIFTAFKNNFTTPNIGYGSAGIVKDSNLTYFAADLLAQPTVPFDQTTAESFSEDEQQLPGRASLMVQVTVAQQNWPLNEADVVVCSDPPSRWIYAGYAITRIRVFSYSHEFARPPVECGLNDSDAAGCLDSCAFSRVRIVGYLRPSTPTALSEAPVTVSHPGFVYPNHEFRWAIVRL